VELDILPKALEFLSSRRLEDQTVADIMALLEAVTDTAPSPSAYPGMRSLQKGIFYYRYYKKGNSIRIYFHCGANHLIVLSFLEKRRTKLTKGEIKQLKNALATAKDLIAHENISTV